MIEIKTSLTLICDRCKATFLFQSVMQAGEPIATGGEREESAIEAIGAIEESCQKLRDLAQQGDWCFVYPHQGHKPRDLCPSCYTLPPEG